MFVYNIGDIIAVLLVVLLVIICIYKLIRYNYIKYKFKKCPECGCETGTITEVKQTFGDMDSYEKIYCRSKYDNKNNPDTKKCNWEFKLRF